MRNIILVLALVLCLCLPTVVMAEEVEEPVGVTEITEPAPSGGGIEPVSVDAVNAKVAEAEGYLMGAASPIIKMIAKIMIVLIVFSFLAVLLTGATAARNAFVALLFVGVGLAIFTAIPQLTDWFINVGNWIAN
jgi:hypothetical protein